MNTAHSFPPLAASGARVLVLGSMPGRASLEAQQYYAHPRNAFWPIMATLFGVDQDAPYAQRCTQLCARDVAVWDVLQSCERPGSLDASIVEDSIVANDFVSLFARCPNIGHVFFNGARADTAYRRYVRPGLSSDFAALNCQRLPSTSPAHASLSVAQKCAEWRALERALGAR